MFYWHLSIKNEKRPAGKIHDGDEKDISCRSMGRDPVEGQGRLYMVRVCDVVAVSYTHLTLPTMAVV